MVNSLNSAWNVFILHLGEHFCPFLVSCHGPHKVIDILRSIPGPLLAFDRDAVRGADFFIPDFTDLALPVRAFLIEHDSISHFESRLPFHNIVITVRRSTDIIIRIQFPDHIRHQASIVLLRFPNLHDGSRLPALHTTVGSDLLSNPETERWTQDATNEQHQRRPATCDDFHYKLGVSTYGRSARFRRAAIYYSNDSIALIHPRLKVYLICIVPCNVPI
mmetsp:Transcript_106752/g.194651  ORF Transcript_106752/g.194651 Transcript_106752/m.194651 type:complete len:219 (-) Transcript_106752:52-708(-)